MARAPTDSSLTQPESKMSPLVYPAPLTPLTGTSASGVDVEPLVLGAEDAAFEFHRRVRLPDASELAALEREAGAAVDAIAPTRSSALLKALCVIGHDPRASLQRIHDLISSLVAELSLLIPQQSQDVLRPWLVPTSASDSADSGFIAARPASNEASVEGGASQIVAPAAAFTPRVLQPRHLELDRMLRSQAGAPATPTERHGRRERVASLESLSPTTPATCPEGAVMDDWCCGGESLWIMRERWQKLQNDFFSEKKDRFDLSKIPGEICLVM